MKKSDVNVLIIDDDSAILNVLSEAVRTAGYRPIPITKPGDALNIIKIKPIHAAIVDCLLPGRNGVDLVLDIKRNGFESIPFFLISGVFKDKNFQSEAIQKTKAIQFFTKPFDIKDLLAALDKEMAKVISTPKMDLHSLLTKPFASERDRRKALDHIDSVTGFDFPFILNILAEAKSSGHLNLVAPDGEIFSVSFANGKVINTDSAQSRLAIRHSLIKAGYIEAEEFDHITKSTKGDILKVLIQQSIVSPHSMVEIKQNVILAELRNLVMISNLSANFSPDRQIVETEWALGPDEINPFVHEVVYSTIEHNWLKSFYRNWINHPIIILDKLQTEGWIAKMPVVQHCKGLIERLSSSPTLHELLESGKFEEEALLRALHYLAISRIFFFEEILRMRSLEEIKNRLEVLERDLLKLTPVGIFRYFGAGDSPTDRQIEGIYSEFIKSNDPALLPAKASVELREINQRVYTIVEKAREVMLDPTQRNNLLEQERQIEISARMRAEEQVDKAIVLIGKGNLSEARRILDDGQKKFPSDRGHLALAWVQLRGSPTLTQDIAVQIKTRIDQVSPEGRRSAFFFFVLGLFRKGMGDIKGAIQTFERAVQVDANYLDARREISELKDKLEADVDILTGDLTTVVNNFFKKLKK